ncbi:hypothetical protein K6W37_17290, partial [Acetobacter senegalensis]|nr:hypothetical protein [Acetobacter senegalensis]
MEEGKEVFSCTSRKAIESVTDQICMCALVYQEADRESFWGGTIVYIWYVWDTSTNGEASHHWSGRIVEVRG